MLRRHQKVPHLAEMVIPFFQTKARYRFLCSYPTMLCCDPKGTTPCGDGISAFPHQSPLQILVQLSNDAVLPPEEFHTLRRWQFRFSTPKPATDSCAVIQQCCVATLRAPHLAEMVGWSGRKCKICILTPPLQTFQNHPQTIPWGV